MTVWKWFYLLWALRVLPLSVGSEGVCAGSNCPAFVCPTVRDEVAGDEIQLELQQIERPPIKSLEEFGIPSSLTHWQCAAQIVCKELGHAKAVAWLGASVYGEGTGRIWLDNTVCTGTEESLYRCRKSPIGVNTCDHGQDAGVVCDLKGRILVGERTSTESSFFISEVSKNSFEPFGSTEGRVYSVDFDSVRGWLYALAKVGGTGIKCRVFRRELGSNQWKAFAYSPICDVFSSCRTYYILRQTGIITGDLPRQSERVLHAFTDPGSRPNVRGLALDEVGGTLFFSVGAGMLKMINIKGTSQEVDVPIALDVTVTPFSLFFESGWLAAQVVCKELGYTKGLAWSGAYEEGTGRIWLDNTVCSGAEESLYRCRKSPIGANTCHHGQDAGVVCDLKGRLLVVERNNAQSSVFISEVSKSTFEPFGSMQGKVYSVSYDSVRGCLYAMLLQVGGGGRIVRWELGSNQWTSIAHFTACNGYNSLAVDETDGYFYWTTSDGKFYRRDPNQPGYKELLCQYNQIAYPRSLVIRQSQRTYYILRQTGIITGDLPRQSERVLHAFADPGSRPNVRGLALDEVGGALFFSVGAGILKMINIEGTSQEVDVPIALDVTVTPFSMFFESGWLVWAAQVVCKELGYTKAVAWPDASAYGEGTGQIWLDNTVCSGTEESLYRCRKSPIGVNTCDHGQDAGVVCDLKGRLLVVEKNSTDSSFFISDASKSSFESIGWKQGKVYSVYYDSLRGYNSLAVDETDGYVYWTASSGEFYRRDPDKESGKSLLYNYSSDIYPRSLVIRQSTRTYYILRQTGIITGDLPRQSERVLHAFADPDSRSYVRGLALDEVGGALFFSVGAGTLKMINIEGTSQEVDVPIALDVTVTPFSLFFESGWLVWVESTLRRVARWAPRTGFGNITYHSVEGVSADLMVVALIPDN
ncbi:scavenger receptor cysteine-rich type 1 protein M130-like [Diadema antillarum]|uniref:scavenger receptor cysteine-rich type 1 protein M130-like n=1 Tax=Diadema antillarum TaxID=105358 RepID=UPI003A8B7023